MKITSGFAIVSLIFCALLKTANGASTGIVYCQDPISGSLTFSYCGDTRIISGMFPGPLGYAALNDGFVVSTSIWTQEYISVKFSTSVTSTNVYHAATVAGVATCSQKLMGCQNFPVLFSATTTYFTIFAPTGDIATMTDVRETTVTATVTATSTTTLSWTATTTETSTATVTNTLVLHDTVTSTEIDTTTVTDTLTGNEGLTVTVTEDNGTCPAPNVETITETQTVKDPTTITQSITYNVGSGGELTIYTSGPAVGTSTYTSCF